MIKCKKTPRKKCSFVAEEADVLQNTLTWPAAAAGHVIQLNKTAVVVAKPFRPEAESPLLQRNSFRPDVSKMFRNKTFFILFNCTYTSFRPPPGLERLPVWPYPCLQGFLLSTFHVFSDYTIPITNSQAPTTPPPARQTTGQPQAPAGSPPRPTPKPSQFFKIRVSPPSVQKSVNFGLHTPYGPSKRQKPHFIFCSLPPAFLRHLKILCKFQNKGLKIGKFFV